MPELIVFLTADTDGAEVLLNRWRQEGVTWAFIFEARAIARRPEQLSRDDLPMFPSLARLLEGDLSHATCVAGLAPDAAVRDRMLAALPEGTGHGQAIVLPVSRVLENRPAAR